MAVSQYDFVNVESGTDETYVPMDQEPEVYDASAAIDEINGSIVTGTLETKIDYLADTKSDIREAIIDKGVEVAETDPFRSYAEKIGEIVGGEINNQDITVTENGVYEAESGYTGLGEVTVEVPDPTLETATITRNGTYTPTAYGFSEVTVDVDTVNNQNKTVTENGTYTPDTGYTGLGQVVVEVPESTFETGRFTENGTYTPTADGYSEVTVEVPEPVLTPLSVTENGNYEPSGDGYSSVSVNVQPTLENKTIRVNGTYRAGSGYDGFGTVEVDVADIPAVVEPLSVTPTTSQQVITPTTGVDGFSTVTVGAVTSSIDSNIATGNIKSGVSILGVNGSVVELNGETATVTPSTSQQTITPTSPHNGLTEVTVNAVDSTIDSNITAGNIKSGVSILGVNGSVTELNADSLSVTPTTSAQLIQPTSPYNAFNQVSVSAVTSAIDPNIAAGNIKSGVSILGVTGNVIEANETTLSVTPTTSAQTLTPTSPYSGFNEVNVSAVDSSIDSNIVAGNIRNGVSILGVTGNLNPVINQYKTATMNGVYEPDAGYTGLARVTVNVSGAALTNGCFKGYAVSAANTLVLGNRVPDTTSSSIVSLTGIIDLGTEVLANSYTGNTNIVGTLDLSSLQKVTGYQAAIWAFGGCTGITSVNMSNVKTITGVTACAYMFSGCTGITSFDLSSLEDVSDNYSGCSGMFKGCTGITTANLSALKRVTSQGGTSSMFEDCSNLVSVDLSSLEDLTIRGHLQYMFSGCVALTSLSFPALTPSSFDGRTTIFVNMCNGIPNITLHFPASVQSIIETMQGYSTTAPFGALSGTVLFDL